MLRPYGWGHRLRRSGPAACLVAFAGLVLGGSALGSTANESPAISTVAGDGSVGYAGDGGPAVNASLNAPESVAALRDGSFLIADKENSRVRRVSPDGTIATVAGSGTAGYDLDGVPAVSAKLNRPEGVAALPDGGFLIADTGNNRIRRVCACSGSSRRSPAPGPRATRATAASRCWRSSTGRARWHPRRTGTF